MMDRIGIMFFIPQLRYSWARLDPIGFSYTKYRQNIDRSVFVFSSVYIPPMFYLHGYIQLDTMFRLGSSYVLFNMFLLFSVE